MSSLLTYIMYAKWEDSAQAVLSRLIHKTFQEVFTNLHTNPTFIFKMVYLLPLYLQQINTDFSSDKYGNIRTIINVHLLSLMKKN